MGDAEEQELTARGKKDDEEKKNSERKKGD